MKEAYIEPETHLTQKQSGNIDHEEAVIFAAFDRLTEKIKHGRTTDTVHSSSVSAGWGATEAMANEAVADFLDLAIPEKAFDTTPYLNTVVHDWLIGKDLSESDLNLLKRYYFNAVKKGKIRLQAQNLN